MVLIIAIGFVIGGLIAIPISNWILGGNGTKFDANGQIGDFVGGLLNPVIALLALIWVRRGVQSQEKELLDSKEALRVSAEAQKKQVRIAAITALLTDVNDEIDRFKKSKQLKYKILEDSKEQYARFMKYDFHVGDRDRINKKQELSETVSSKKADLDSINRNIDILASERGRYLSELKELIK